MPRFWTSKNAVRFLVVTVVLLAVAWEFPREIARWYGAAALEHELDGKLPAALRSVDRAIAWAESRSTWWRLKTEFLLEAGRPDEALRAAQRIFELEGESFTVLRLRATAYQALGEFEKAADQWERIAKQWGSGDSPLGRLDPDRREQQASIQNALAYARALARIHLEEAEQQALAAVKAVDDRRVRLAPRPYILLCAAASYSEFHQYSQALSCLAAADRELRQLVHRYQSRATALRDLGAEAYVDDVQKLRSMLIAANVERYRVYRQLELDEPAKELADVVARLNGDLDADGWGVKLPRGFELAQTMAAYLDTLGFIRLQRGDDQAALAPLDHASKIAEALPEALQHSLALISRQRVDIRRNQKQIPAIKQTIAVTLYHRGLAYRAAGNSTIAEQSMARVRELGFTPGPELF